MGINKAIRMDLKMLICGLIFFFRLFSLQDGNVSYFQYEFSYRREQTRRNLRENMIKVFCHIVFQSEIRWSNRNWGGDETDYKEELYQRKCFMVLS